MCVIIASPKGDRVSDDLIDEAFRSNKDGAGIAWIKDGRVFWHKGLMNVADLKEAYKDIEGPHAIHFRLATHGGVRPELTHPFPITDQVRLDCTGSAHQLLMHNGVYNDWDKDLRAAILSSGKPCPVGPWSDSRGVAFIVKQFGAAILNLMGASRYLVLCGDKSKGMSFFGDWAKYENLMFSNRMSNIAFPVSGGYSYTNRGSATRSPTTTTVAPASTVGTNQTGHGTGVGTTSSSTESKALRQSHWRHFTDDGRYKQDIGEMAKTTALAKVDNEGGK